MGKMTFIFILLCITSLPCLAQDGVLDTGFGTGGIVITGSFDGSGVAIQADGKIVCAGSSSNGSNNDFAVVRYNINGTLDTGFDIDGIVKTDFASSNDNGYSVAIQTDGKIVVAGSSTSDRITAIAVVRYNSNGTLDSDFGTGGKVTTAIGSSNDCALSVAIQADGKIVVAGFSLNGSYYDLAVVRYNSDGTLDTAFGTGGIVVLHGESGYLGNSVAIQADGKIVVAGIKKFPDANLSGNFLVVRYNSNGTLDSDFGTDGIVYTAKF